MVMVVVVVSVGGGGVVGYILPESVVFAVA